MKRKLGFLSVLVMQFAVACAHVDTFAQDIELIRTSDEQMLQKMDLIQQLLIELKNNQVSTDIKIQKFAGDLTQVRENQAKSEVLNQEKSKLLNQLTDSSHQEKQCDCVLEKLSPVNDKLLKSAALIERLVKNSTKMFQQIRETKALAQDCGNATSEVTQKLSKLKFDEAVILKENSTDASPIAKQPDISVTEVATTAEATNKEPVKCFKMSASIVKSNLIFVNKSVFYYTNSPMNWFIAQRFCHSFGMDLATLKTEAEINQVKARIPVYHGYGVWVSASNKVAHAASFYWADNTPMVYDSYWLPGSPHNFRRAARACVWLDAAKGKFGDYDCSGKSRMFCQATSCS